jgi:hypothetical protein
MNVVRFQPGQLVYARDLGNYGYVIADDGGPKVQAEFTNPETGSVKAPWLDRALLSPVEGSARSNLSDQGRSISVAIDRKSASGPILTGPDYWLVAKLLSGGSLNGELELASPAFRGLADLLVATELAHRGIAWNGFLAGRSDRDAIVRGVADVKPDEPPPATDPPRRSAHLGDLAHADHESRFIWPGWLVRGHFNLLSSHPKIGKTHLALDLARRIDFALLWPDGQPPSFSEGSRTLWICGDRHQDELRERAAAFGLPPEAVRLNAYPDDPYSGWDLDDPNNLARLAELIDLERPALVVIDTVWRSTRRRLSREHEVNIFADPIVTIAQNSECAILGLMHLSKDDETLGRRLEGLSRSILKLSRPDPSQPNRRKLTCTGNHKEPSALGVTLHDRGCDYDSTPPEDAPKSAGGRPANERDTAKRFILDALSKENGQVGNELAAKCHDQHGVEKKTFWRAVDDLCESGEVTKAGGPGTGRQFALHRVVPGQNPQDL